MAATGIVEEWRRDDLGLGIGGGRRPQRRWLKVKMVSAAAECWSVGSGGWWVDVADGSRWVFFFLFFFFFAFYWLSTVVCCTDRKFALIPKLT